MLRNIANLEIRAASAEDLILKDGIVTGVLTADGEEIACGKVVLTTGTFLNGLIHIGETKIPAGRMKIADGVEAPSHRSVQDALWFWSADGPAEDRHAAAPGWPHHRLGRRWRCSRAMTRPRPSPS